MGGAAPYAGMVMAECAQVGLMIISKAAMSSGMTNFAFVLYSNALASLILLPLSFLLHSSSSRPPLTFAIICEFFLLGLFGCFAQIFGYAGIKYSSPTLGTAMLNLIPAFTFILAIIFRMERLVWRSASSQAKSIGTVVSIAGAFVATFYEGPPILVTPSNSNSHLQSFASEQSDWVIGGLFLGVDCVLASLWLIVQASVLRKYPAELIAVFFYAFFVTLLSGIVCLIMQRDPSAWSLKPTLRLIAVLYSAIFGTIFRLGVTTWCLHRTGPVFVAMFKPLGIVIAVFIGVVFLGDTFYLGSLVGAIVIVIGFYLVMWGKSRENKVEEDSGARSSETTKRVPLLQNEDEENRSLLQQ